MFTVPKASLKCMLDVELNMRSGSRFQIDTTLLQYGFREYFHIHWYVHVCCGVCIASDSLNVTVVDPCINCYNMCFVGVFLILNNIAIQFQSNHHWCLTGDFRSADRQLREATWLSTATHPSHNYTGCLSMHGNYWSQSVRYLISP